MDQDMGSNSVKRDNAIFMIENVAAWFKSSGKSATLAQLEVHLEHFEYWHLVFSKNQGKLELKTVDHEAMKQERDIRNQFNANYLHVKASLQQEISIKTPRIEEEDSSTLGTATHGVAFTTPVGDNLRPGGGLQFKGDRKEWSRFWEKFRTLYHSNELLSPAEKLICLQDCCKDDAYEKVHRLEPTDANYKVAIEILKQNYEDVQPACHDHVAAICNLPIVPEDSVFALRTFVDELNKHIRALSSLDLPVDSWCDLMIYLAKMKLYRNIFVEWQRESIDERFPRHIAFIKFLQRRVQILEGVNSDSRSTSSKQLTSVGIHRKSDTKPLPKDHAPTLDTKPLSKEHAPTLATSGNLKPMDERKPCPICSTTTHFIQLCLQFQALTVGQRRDVIKRLKICENCLRNHGPASCKSQSRCLICQQRHHTLIHREASIAQHKPTEKTPPVHEDHQPKIPVIEREGSKLFAAPPNSTKLLQQTSVLLHTALVNVQRKDGTILSCRYLVDPCSSLHLVTEEFAQLLRVSRIRCRQTISATGEKPLISTWRIPIIVQSRTSDFWTKLEAHIVRTITLPQPGNAVDVTTVKQPEDIPMDPDSGFQIPQKIDLLIGAELLNELLKHSPILHKNLINTNF